MEMSYIEENDEMSHYAVLIWVFIVCQSIHLGVSGPKRVNAMLQMVDCMTII